MDEELRALYWAAHELPAPEHVRNAEQARADLWERVKSAPFRALARDEQRLDQHYAAISDAYRAEALKAYRRTR